MTVPPFRRVTPGHRGEQILMRRPGRRQALSLRLIAIIQLTEGLMPDVKVIVPARRAAAIRLSRLPRVRLPAPASRSPPRGQAGSAAIRLAPSRSGSPDESQCAAVGAARPRLHGPDKLGRPGAETGGNQPVRLAEQPVNPDVDVPAGHLDRPAGGGAHNDPA